VAGVVVIQLLPLREVVARRERRVVGDPLLHPVGERQQQHFGDVAGHVHEVGVAESIRVASIA
jgi:hypothetical protein